MAPKANDTDSECYISYSGVLLSSSVDNFKNNSTDASARCNDQLEQSRRCTSVDERGWNIAQWCKEYPYPYIYSLWGLESHQHARWCVRPTFRTGSKYLATVIQAECFPRYVSMSVASVERRIFERIISASYILKHSDERPAVEASQLSTECWTVSERSGWGFNSAESWVGVMSHR